MATGIDVFRKEYEFKYVNFSTVNSVLGLIVLRSKLDKYYDYEFTEDYLSSSNWKEVNQELICVYADLDMLIDQCKFSEGDLNLIQALEMGYTPNDIADMVGESIKRINTRARNLARKIYRQNWDNWVVWAHLNYIKTEWKTCRICGRSLPLGERFFSNREEMSDGYSNECKECLNKLKNANK